jgi:hypothetical protein
MDVLDVLLSNADFEECSLEALVEARWIIRQLWLTRLTREIDQRIDAGTLIEAAKAEQVETQLAKAWMHGKF